jgi:hypothetical protein
MGKACKNYKLILYNLVIHFHYIKFSHYGLQVYTTAMFVTVNIKKKNLYGFAVSISI